MKTKKAKLRWLPPSGPPILPSRPLYLIINNHHAHHSFFQLRPSPLGEENEDSVDSFSIGRRLLHGLLIEGALYAVLHPVCHSRIIKRLPLFCLCFIDSNGDGLSGWFAGCVLSYILTDSPTCKKVPPKPIGPLCPCSLQGRS